MTPLRFATASCALLLLVVTSCQHRAATPELTGTRVLFIGNSLTTANDLPRMLTALAAAGGFTVSTRQVVFDDHSLADHLRRGDAVAAIRGRDWDYVVLQQGPSGLPASRVELIDSARRFDVVIRTEGGAPALYMVWPDASRRTAFDSVSLSYTQAADAVDGLLFPGADAWVRTRDRDALPSQAVRVNVRASADHLRHGSEVLEQLIQNDGLLVVGAEYSVESGLVEFFDGLPKSE